MLPKHQRIDSNQKGAEGANFRRERFTRRFSALPPLLVFLHALVGLASAATIVDDFSDGNDQGWTHYEPLAPFSAPGTFTVSAGAYRLQAPPSPSQSTLGPGRAGSLRLDGTYTDFFLSVDIVAWDDTADQAIGLLSRLQQTGLGTTDGYGFLYVVADQDFEIERFDNETDHRIGPIVDLALDPARDYRMTFTATGSDFTGQVFDLADLGTPLLTITATDTTYASGVTGLLVVDASSGGVTSDATFDNYFAAPEPGSFLLFAAGSFVFGACFRRRA